jgi:hypothetical protein
VVVDLDTLTYVAEVLKEMIVENVSYAGTGDWFSLQACI